MRSLAEAAVPMLVNALWQLPLLVALGKLAAWQLRRAPAAHLHALWLAVLLVGVALPVASPFLTTRSALGASLRSAAPEAGEPAPATPAEGAVEHEAARWTAALPASTLRGAGRIALGLYLVLVAFAALRLAVAVRRASSLRNRAELLPEGSPVAAIAARLGPALGVRRVELFASAEVAGPVTVGIGRPAILLPSWLLAGAGRAELEAVLAHELAHVARRDCAVQLAAELLLLPLAPHPAAWWLRAEVVRAREMACDEAAAALADGRTYARSLLGLAVSIAGHNGSAATLGAFDADHLEERMKRLLDGPRRLPLSRARWALAGCFLALLAAAWSAAGFALAAPASSTDLARLVGVWRGNYDQGEGKGMPGATLTVTTVDGQPRVAILMYRHLKQADGSLRSAATGFPVVDVAFAQGRLTFRSRDDNFTFKGGPRESVDYEWAFEAVGENQGLLSLLHNSRFKAPAARGEHVPPGPPPIEMQKDP